MNQPKPLGILYLVPTPLDGGASDNPIQEHLPTQTLRVAAQLQYWITENAKTTRAFLKRVDAVAALATPIQNQHIQELPRAIHKAGDHRSDFDASPMLQAAMQGMDIGLVSEAGMPAIADPGSSVVRAAHRLGISVVPLVGPVSLLLALAASGLNGQSFAFVGYVPTQAAERNQKIKALEDLARRTGQSQILIETPYRNGALLQALLQTLQPSTRLATASGITTPQAQYYSAEVQHWRRHGWTLNNQMPTVFVLG
jgi:16S rRNA (cytidine1402-2'-O)-methyltransferase